jgi:hypothetical protein
VIPAFLVSLDISACGSEFWGFDSQSAVTLDELWLQDSPGESIHHHWMIGAQYLQKSKAVRPMDAIQSLFVTNDELLCHWQKRACPTF